MALATVAAAPLALGAVHLWTTLALSAAGCLALLLLALARPDGGIRVGWAALVLPAFAAVCALQLVPLPGALLELLAPATFELTGYVLGPEAGARPISLDLPATAADLAKIVGWACLFLVLQHLAGDSRRARRRLLATVAGAGVLVAVIGIGHMVAGAEALFGIWTPSQHPVFLTTFGNPNHLAGTLNAAALLALGLAVSSVQLQRKLAWGFAFALAAAGSIVAASRGGMVALGVGMLLLVFLGPRAGQGLGTGENVATTNRAPWFIALAAVVVLGLAGSLYLRMPAVSREVDSLASLQLAKEDKLEIAKTAIAAIRANWMVGIGSGAFGTAHPRYLPGPAFATFTHVENEPLQALAELGVPLGGALILSVLLAWFALARRGRGSWLEAGAAAAAFALLGHSLVDFGLHFAAGISLLALLALRDTSVGRLRLRSLPAAALATLAAVAVALAGNGALPGLQDDTDRLLALAGVPGVGRDELESAARHALQRRPADYLPCEVAAAHALQAPKGAARALPWLNRELYLNPTSGVAHRLAGDVLARLGRRSQALLELRTAASLGTPTVPIVLAHYPDSEAILAATPEAAGPVVAAVNLLARAGRREDALLVVQRAAAAAPQDATLAEMLHSLHSQLGRHEDALAVATQLRAANGGSPRPFALEAASLAKLGKLVEAQAVYAQGLAAAPGDPELVLGLARFELAARRPDVALAALEKLPPGAAAAHQATRRLLRGRAYRAKGDDVRAREELRVGLRLQPDHQELLVALAEVYVALGRLDDAEKTLASVPASNTAGAQLRAVLARRQEELRKMSETLGSPGPTPP